MRRSPDVSPRRLSDISPQLRQLKYLVVDESIKEDLKWSRSVEDLTSGPVGLTSIEERILRITGYYGYQPWATSYKSKTLPPSTLQVPPQPRLRPGPIFLVRWRICLAVGSAVSGSAPRLESSPSLLSCPHTQTQVCKF